MDGIPYRDEKWREHFFFFKVNQVSMENCYFLKLPREWAEDIGWSFSLFIFMSCFKARLLSNTFDFFLFLVYSGSSPMYDKLE